MRYFCRNVENDIIRLNKGHNNSISGIHFVTVNLTAVYRLKYSRFPHTRNHFFGYSLLFSNNSLLFYPLFYMINLFLTEGGFLYVGTYCTIRILRSEWLKGSPYIGVRTSVRTGKRSITLNNALTQ